jgi:glycosyltransferase involved in cell wall biosynthesis
MEQNQMLAPVQLARDTAKRTQGRGIRPIDGASNHFFPAISVIIPAHNEEDYLGATLKALTRQEYPELEIVVVANGCHDRTAEVAKGNCHRLVTLSQKSLGVARNLGARMAMGELLVFLDADTVLEPGALRVVATEFRELDAGGTLKGLPDSNRFAYRLIYWLKNFIHRFVVQNGSSGVILCWKEDFVRVGGFDEQLELRENSDLIRRLKRFGSYRFINTTTATTSMRRYERRGVRRIVWLWIKLWFFGFFGDLRNRRYEPIR